MNYFHNSKLRILNFTHSDMDGAVSNIVLRNYYKNIITQTITYEHENEIIPKMIKFKNKFDAVIFTDFCPINLSQVQAFGRPVLVLDHHESAIKFNNPKSNIYIVPKFCGAKLTYEFYNNNDCLNHLKDIVDITNDYDMYILKDQRSKHYNSLYWKMGFNWFCERFLTGETNLLNFEKQFLVRRKKEFEELYKNLPIQELSNNGVVCESDTFLGEISDALRNDGYKWCILYHNGILSVRSTNDSGINLVNVTKRLGKGGGHEHSAGIPQQKENLMTLIKRIENEVNIELNNNNDLDDFSKKLAGI